MMESESQLITGYPVLKKTALRLGIITPESSDQEVNAAVQGLESKIKTEKIGSTNIIKIIAKTKRAQEAVELANAVAKVYIEENLLSKTLQARSARQFIE
ncbi:MAG: hypothetical protein PHO30_08815, partial [Candidatus Omnitrophica bacterium]|nr:hypothetical protein [Candidatus Omnitrophota bacterium]